MTERLWYVVETKEGGGDRAQLALAVAGLELWRPFDVRRDPARGKSGKPRADIRWPRFGRYFFFRAEMSDFLREAIVRAPGVAGILCESGADRPAVVPDAQIAWLKANKDHEIPVDNLPVKGDGIRIKCGPFASLEGRVKEVDKRGVIRAEIATLGRAVPVIVESAHVEIVQSAKSRAIAYKGRSA